MNVEHTFIYTQLGTYDPDYQAVFIEKRPKGFFVTYAPEFYTTYLIEKKRK